MKNITLLIISLFFIGCAQNNEEYNQLKADKEYVESNVKMYSDVWNAVFSEKNIDLVIEIIRGEQTKISSINFL